MQIEVTVNGQLVYYYNVRRTSDARVLCLCMCPNGTCTHGYVVLSCCYYPFISILYSYHRGGIVRTVLGIDDVEKKKKEMAKLAVLYSRKNTIHLKSLDRVCRRYTYTLYPHSFRVNTYRNLECPQLPRVLQPKNVKYDSPVSSRYNVAVHSRS